MKTERKELEIFGVIFQLIICIVMLQYLTGCMQLTGAKKIDLWGAKFEANNGIEVSAGVQQYDYVADTRGIGTKDSK